MFYPIECLPSLKSSIDSIDLTKIIDPKHRDDYDIINLALPVLCICTFPSVDSFISVCIDHLSLLETRAPAPSELSILVPL